MKKVILIGHSYGGFTPSMGASNDNEVRCVAGLADAEFGAINSALKAQSEYRTGKLAYVESLAMLSGQTEKKTVGGIGALCDSV